MVICLERDADLHMAQLMSLPLIFSCFSKIQIGFAFLVPAHPVSPGQRAVKSVCVCVCVCVLRVYPELRCVCRCRSDDGLQHAAAAGFVAVPVVGVGLANVTTSPASVSSRLAFIDVSAV